MNKSRLLSNNAIRLWPALFAALAIYFLAWLIIAPVALAQGLPVLYGVTDRVAPNDEAMGTKLGGFTAYPKLALLTGYDGNLLATETNELSSARFQVDPSLALESDWSRHALQLGGFLSSRIYSEHSSQDNLNWGVGGAGTLDVLENADLGAMVGYQQLTDPRGGINGPINSPDPVQYDLIQASTAGSYRVNKVDLSMVANLQVYEYDEASQKYRNREVYSLTGQIGYSFSPGYEAFVRGTNTKTDFNNLSAPLPPPAVPGTRVTQDSEGYRVAAGISSEITNLISGEAFVGYLDQDYQSTQFEDVSGVSFGVDLTWKASELTTVRLTGSREVMDSTNPIAGGIFYSIGTIGIDHELTRGLDLKGDFSYYNADYVGSKRDDDGFRFSLGADYRLSQRVQLNLTYTYDDRDSNFSGQSYTRNLVMMGVTLQH
ncbi:MAG: outer membrane beta-barrel protein [Myxococcota bacterium]|nr:outer membrane beta-barrel protein [Myxococcota bacterium]